MGNGVRAKEVDVKIMLTRNAARVANAVFMVVLPYDYYIVLGNHGEHPPGYIVTHHDT